MCRHVQASTCEGSVTNLEQQYGVSPLSSLSVFYPLPLPHPPKKEKEACQEWWRCTGPEPQVTEIDTSNFKKNKRKATKKCFSSCADDLSDSILLRHQKPSVKPVMDSFQSVSFSKTKYHPIVVVLLDSPV